MEIFQGMLQDVPPPWGLRLKSILVDEYVPCDQWSPSMMVAGFGMISEINEGIWVNAASLVPFEGVKECQQWSFHFPQETVLCLPKGTWIGFDNIVVHSIDHVSSVVELRFQSKSNVWVVPDFIQEFPLNCVHFFCGAFSGWERALVWMGRKRFFCLQQSFSIDWNDEAMRVWQLRTNAVVLNPPFGFDTTFTDLEYGILGNIQCDDWINIFRHQTNLIFTMSPPCQPWSLGGKGQGFMSENGLCMAHAIRKVCHHRPVAVCFECADQIIKHEHYNLIKAAFRVAAYTLHWSTVMAMDRFGMQRSRFLAVWIRNDVVAKSPQLSRLCDVQMMKWNNSLYQFPIPDQVEHQLKLSKELLEMYGNVGFLPKSSRTRLGPHPSVTDVLRARVLNEDDIVPTLVASYTQQHLIDHNHLCQKGIFAFLVEGPQGFKFVDPFRFVSLLGAPLSEIVPLPIKIDIAFRHLGNAISVPHALTTILVALVGCRFVTLPIVEIVHQCWNQRIDAKNSAVIRNKDFAFLVPRELLSVAIATHCLSQPLPQSKLLIKFGDIGIFDIGKLDGASLFRDIRHVFGIDRNDRGFSFRSSQGVIPLHDKISDIMGETVEGFFHNQFWGTFSLFIGTQPNADHELFDGDELDQVISRSIALCEKNIVHEMGVSPTIPYVIENSQTDRDIRVDKHAHRVCTALQHDTHETGDINTDATDSVWVFVHCNPNPLTTNWPKGISNEAASLRVKFLLPPDQKGIHYLCECKNHDIPKVDRIFIVIPHEVHPDFAVVLMRSPTSNFVSVKAVFRESIPWNVVVKECPDVCSVRINGIQTNHFVKTSFRDGDCIEVSSKRIRIANETPQDFDRADQFHKQGRPLAIDECNWFMKCLNKCENIFAHQTFCPEDLSAHFVSIVHEHCQRGSKTTIIPILFPGHWAGCEIAGQDTIKISFINLPHGSSAFRNEIVNKVRLINSKECHLDKQTLRSQDGFCGWSLLYKWWVANPQIARSASEFAFVFRCEYDPIVGTLGDQPFDASSIAVWEFAIFIRTRFIRSCPRITSNELLPTGSTLTNDDAPMDGQQPSQAIDTWSFSDPWSSDKKVCKWEDLKLPSDHYFKFKDNSRPPLMHKQQLNNSSKAIAFATKAAVVAVFNTIQCKSVALIVPASDRNRFDNKPELKVSGPFEIVVQDDVSATVYKRQIHLVQIADEVSFEMPKPSYKASAPELKEIVLEIDERLISKETIAAITDKPLDFFKKKFVDLVPANASKNVNIYSFRVVPVNNPQHRIFQAMCKVQASQRIPCLERSGATELFIRDFIPRGEEIQDVTTLPRFWPCDKSSREDALRTAMNVAGYAGLTLTRRGIAVRCDCKKIGDMRKILLPNDDRICGLNISVVPKIAIESTGWPSSISAHEVVKATAHAVSVPPVPTRCYKVLGLTTWTLTFETPPSVSKFLIDFNGSSYEILLSSPIEKTSESKNIKKSKGNGKGKGKSAKGHQGEDKSAAIEKADANSNRISVLEAKFTSMERRQDSLESKINDGFCSVNDQLRQVLNAIAPRTPQEPTGLSPPPKIQKSVWCPYLGLFCRVNPHPLEFSVCFSFSSLCIVFGVTIVMG